MILRTSPLNLDGHPEFVHTRYGHYRHHGDDSWFCLEVGRLCQQYTSSEWTLWWNEQDANGLGDDSDTFATTIG